MTEQLLPDTLTPIDVSELYAELRDTWRKLLGNEPSRASLLVLMAHWDFETGRGKGCHCFNLANAKHVRGDGRDYTMFRCSEIIAGKEEWFDPPHPATWFRAFTSLADGTYDYLVLLNGEFGYAWPAVQAGDAADFCHRLKARGYYTADEKLYTAGVVRCLAELDKIIGPDTKPEIPGPSPVNGAIGQAEVDIPIDPGDDEPPEAA